MSGEGCEKVAVEKGVMMRWCDHVMAIITSALCNK